MVEVKTIKHSKITDLQLKDICKIKSAFGNYSYESQLKWIHDNIKSEDIHFLIYDNLKLIAYANLIEEYLTVNNEKINILGLGNVCVDEKGKDKGTLLMTNINQYLLNNKRTGLLFCKQNLVPFYIKNGWSLLEPNYSKEVCWMIFNDEFFQNQNIAYAGKLF